MRILTILLLVDFIFLGYCLIDTTYTSIPAKESSLTMTIKDGKLYRQWWSRRSENVEEVIRVGLGDPPPFDMPTMSLKREGKFTSFKMSDWKNSFTQTEEPTHFLHYDIFPEAPLANFPTAKILSGNETQWLILLDLSGTMAEPFRSKDKNSSMQVALKNLIQKRKNTQRDWQLKSFSKGIKDHGLWSTNNTSDILLSMGSAHGPTALIGTLKNIISDLKKKTFIIVVTDGDITESRRDDARATFRALRGSGHRLSILSPHLEALKHFRFAYEEGLVQKTWPEDKKMSTIKESVAVGALGKNYKWMNITPTYAGKKLLPILFSQEGWPLVYYHRHKGHDWFHVIGKPSLNDEDLLNLLAKYWQKSPVVEINEKGLWIDTLGSDLAALKYKSIGEWKEAELFRPGLHHISIEDIKKGGRVMNLMHPKTGPFSISEFRDFIPFSSVDKNKISFAFNPTATISLNKMNLAMWLAVIHGILFLYLFKTTRPAKAKT